MIEEHLTRPRAALRARLPGGRRLAAYAGALALALPAGVLAGRALAPEAPEPQPQPHASRDSTQQRLARILTTLDGARAAGRAELRQARTPNGQEQAARRLARAHGDAASSVHAVPGVRAAALLDGLARTQRAYADLARAARLRGAAGFATARRGVEREETRLPDALAAVTAPTAQTATAPSAASSGTPLAVLVLALAVAAAGAILWLRRRPAPAPAAAASSAATPVAASAATPAAASAATPVAASAATPAAASAATSAAGWRCEIAWAANLRGARFRAVATAPGRRPQVIARSANLASPPFLPPTPDGEALAAARALARRLLAAGWTPTTRAPHWYSQHFDWPGADDPEPLPAQSR